MCLEITYLIHIYKYKKDMALNNQQCLICHKKQTKLLIIKTTSSPLWMTEPFYLNSFPNKYKPL